MKFNMKTLCSIGALLLCSESVWAENFALQVGNIKANSASSTKTLRLSELGKINADELSSVDSLTIEGYSWQKGDINSDQFKNLSNLLEGAKNLKWLTLRHLGLKEIPKQVFNLEHLRTLDVTGNNLTSIPNDIEKLSKLGGLVVNGNKNLTISSELNNLINLRWTSPSDYGVAWKNYRGCRVLDLSNKNLTQIPFDISYIDGYSDVLKVLDLRNNRLVSESFPAFMVQLSGIEKIDLRDNSAIDSIKKLPAPIFGMRGLKKILLSGTNQDLEYNEEEISSVRKEKMEELNSEIASIDKLVNSFGFDNMKEQLLRKKRFCQSILDKLKVADRQKITKAKHLRVIDEAIESATQMFEEAEKEAAKAEAERQRIAQEKAEREAAQAASQVIARESYYSKFGQFFKSMWSRFTDSRLGRFLKTIGQTLFSNR